MRAAAALLSGFMLYGLVGGYASPAFALELDQAQIQSLEAMRGEEMQRLVFQRTPRGPYEASFLTEDEQTVTLADLGGDITVVNLWATWCPPCRKEMPALDRLNAAMAADNINVLAVNVERRGLTKGRNFYDKTGVEHLDLLVDKTASLSQEAAALGLPTTLILDRDGKEVARLTGEAEWDSAEIQKILRHLAKIQAGE